MHYLLVFIVNDNQLHSLWAKHFAGLCVMRLFVNSSNHEINEQNFRYSDKDIPVDCEHITSLLESLILSNSNAASVEQLLEMFRNGDYENAIKSPVQPQDKHFLDSIYNLFGHIRLNTQFQCIIETCTQLTLKFQLLLEHCASKGTALRLISQLIGLFVLKFIMLRQKNKMSHTIQRFLESVELPDDLWIKCVLQAPCKDAK